jgi:hypothetical protein
MSNNIFNTEYRRGFIKSTDINKLNVYFKNLQKLSLKGGKYLEIYNDDIEFMNQLDEDVIQIGGNLLDRFFLKKEEACGKPQKNQPICDTETYLTRLNNITQNSYCSIVTQQNNICDNRCKNRFQEIELIYNVLSDRNTCNKNNDWIKAIRKYIDILICCSDEYSKPEYESFRTVYLKGIASVILETPIFLKEAYNYLCKILNNEKNKISEDFMREYRGLRKLKMQIHPKEYNDKKTELIKKYIQKLGPNGVGIVYASKVSEKIAELYRKK